MVATPTSYDPFSGNCQLIYVESNGLPAVLDFEVTRQFQNYAPSRGLATLRFGLGRVGSAKLAQEAEERGSRSGLTKYQVGFWKDRRKAVFLFALNVARNLVL